MRGASWGATSAPWLLGEGAIVAGVVEKATSEAASGAAALTGSGPSSRAVESITRRRKGSVL